MKVKFLKKLRKRYVWYWLEGKLYVWDRAEEVSSVYRDAEEFIMHQLSYMMMFGAYKRYVTKRLLAKNKGREVCVRVGFGFIAGGIF